jgi:hypothetical protein
MLPANATLRDADASWFTIPKCKVVFRCAAILASADDNRDQSVVLDEVSSFESAHVVWNGLTFLLTGCAWLGSETGRWEWTNFHGFNHAMLKGETVANVLIGKHGSGEVADDLMHID